MKCMCAQTRPRTLIRRSFGGMEFEPMLTPREKSPLPENVPRGVSNPRLCDSEPKHYQLSYSGPLCTHMLFFVLFFCLTQAVSLLHQLTDVVWAVFFHLVCLQFCVSQGRICPSEKRRTGKAKWLSGNIDKKYVKTGNSSENNEWTNISVKKAVMLFRLVLSIIGCCCNAVHSQGNCAAMSFNF